MRHITTSTVLLGLIVGTAYAQPAPFPTAFDLRITYAERPEASGAYRFVFDGERYPRDAQGFGWGFVGWAGPFAPHETNGLFASAYAGVPYVEFSATWLEDGRLRVDQVNHPTITVTGPGNIPEPAALGALGATGLLAQRRRARRTRCSM